jgi:antitoxin ParD1/3/4
MRLDRALALRRLRLTMTDGFATIVCMSTTTMSIALPDELRSCIDQRVRSGRYGNTSESMRELIRRDQEAQASQRLRALIEEGLRSGPCRTLTPSLAAGLERRALGGRR